MLVSCNLAASPLLFAFVALELVARPVVVLALPPHGWDCISCPGNTMLVRICMWLSRVRAVSLAAGSPAPRLRSLHRPDLIYVGLGSLAGWELGHQQPEFQQLRSLVGAHHHFIVRSCGVEYEQSKCICHCGASKDLEEAQPKVQASGACPSCWLVSCRSCMMALLM
jgi:hypothetical protein